MASMPALVKKLPQEGDIRAVEQSMKLSINPSLVIMRECPYSTKTREVLGNPSPPPSRIPSILEISLGLRPREISRVSGNLSGVGDGFPNTSLVLVEHGYNEQDIFIFIVLFYTASSFIQRCQIVLFSIAVPNCPPTTV